MIDVEYDHADRISKSKFDRDLKRCVACGERSRFEAYGFNLKTIRSNRFYYNLFCPECGDRTVHKAPLSVLKLRFHVRRTEPECP